MCCQNMRSTCARSSCGCSQNGSTATLSLDDLQSYVIVPTSTFAEDADTGCGCGCGCNSGCNCGCNSGCNCGCNNTTRNNGCSCGSDW